MARRPVRRGGTAKPWGIIERGIDATAHRAAWLAMLKRDRAFAKSAGSTVFLCWQSTNGDRDWRLSGADEQAYYRAMATEGQTGGS